MSAKMLKKVNNFVSPTMPQEKRLFVRKSSPLQQHASQSNSNTEYRLVFKNKPGRNSSAKVLQHLLMQQFQESVAKNPYAKEIEQIGLHMKPIKNSSKFLTQTQT